MPEVTDEIKALISMPVLWMMRPDQELPPPSSPPEVKDNTDWSTVLDRLGASFTKRSRVKLILVTDDEELEEPMFRTKKVVQEVLVQRPIGIKTASRQPSTLATVTGRPAGSLRLNPSSTVRPTPRPLPLGTQSTIRHMTSTSRLAPTAQRPTTTSRPTSTTARIPPARTTTRPSTAPIKSAPVQSIPAHLMADIPEMPDLILDFSLDL
ncbi:MAG: hypothetical protein EOP04_05635 [Proteobacteria bacterium]|nr:MAG: hypothetical protein EOP04_05635 [Pseudomonadota bacterium]